jgi:hypothetical protein
MSFLGGQPVELQILKPYVKSKVETSAGLMLELEWDRSFERLIMSSRRMSMSFDSINTYVAAHTMVRQDDMDETWTRCFPKLLGTEVTLKWEGALFRKQAFCVSPNVKTIRNVVPEVIEDDSLARSLNEDPVLRKLISEGRPEEFSVDLSIDQEALSSPIALRSFLARPKAIMWTAEVESYVARGIGVNKTITSIIDMLDLAIKRAVENSKRIREAEQGD